MTHYQKHNHESVEQLNKEHPDSHVISVGELRDMLKFAKDMKLTHSQDIIWQDHMLRVPGSKTLWLVLPGKVSEEDKRNYPTLYAEPENLVEATIASDYPVESQ